MSVYWDLQLGDALQVHRVLVSAKIVVTGFSPETDVTAEHGYPNSEIKDAHCVLLAAGCCLCLITSPSASRCYEVVCAECISYVQAGTPK